MNNKLLYLKFKGARTYLHGSDIFNALEDLSSEMNSSFLAKLVFKSFARQQVEVMIDRPIDEAMVIGHGIWKSAAGENLNFWLQETSITVTESYVYDEDSILTHLDFSNEQVILEAHNSYSTIENVIALTKQLNYALTPNVNGRWLFAQIDLRMKLPETWRELSIVRTNCVANRFSRNVILVNEEDIGEIRFIGGSP